MNHLRSWFLMPAITLSAVLAIHAAVQLSADWRMGWLGALLANAPLPLFMIDLMTGRHARTAAIPPLWLTLSSLGFVLSSAAPWLFGDPLVCAASAGMGLALLVLYLFWYSVLDRRHDGALRIGRPLPSFALIDLAGAAVDSRRFEGKPTLWMFYRGNWCPLCMAQIREVAAQWRSLADLGIEVLLVSPQPQTHSQSLAHRFDAPMQFLVDAGGDAARRLGILAQNGLPKGMEVLGYDSDTVMPTVILTDADGSIVYLHAADNYRVRPSIETLLEVARSHLSD
jgi:peroxiredoxin